ncbi:hypothetical protein [Pengzhenrongella sicca]|uniref:Uncharacterized protein n=1 Tax=Pengzhenrongella sicca TaxID=2819238 RepID=A0A8A4ZKR1_9MICO|nr:hypothetical protein [Pengzhenrongella sicca]QTE30168.1 hypothetical protein J4E96_03895 [Pengzhenrongella sicca]
MSAPGRLLGFALVLAAALGAGYGVGALVGPVSTDVGVPTVVETAPAMPGGHS